MSSLYTSLPITTTTLQSDFKNLLEQSEALLLQSIDLAHLPSFQQPNHPTVLSFQQEYHSIQSQLIELEKKLSNAEHQFQLPSTQLKALEDQCIRIQTILQQIVDLTSDMNWNASLHSNGHSTAITSLLKTKLIDSSSSNREQLLQPSRLNSNPPALSPFTTLESSVLMQQQETLIQDQDQTLDQLTIVIQRQKSMAIDMGEELDAQVEILNHLGTHLDRTQSRLDHAKNRLSKVSSKLKKNSTCCIILGLFLVLLLILFI